MSASLSGLSPRLNGGIRLVKNCNWTPGRRDETLYDLINFRFGSVVFCSRGSL